MKRSLATLVISVLAAPVAHANVEIGGTAGVHVFNEDNALGVENRPDAESLKNSALFALRLGIYFGDMFGIEIEGGVIPTEPRKMVLDVYNAVYRAQLVAQFRAASPENKMIPFLFVGGGAIEVVNSSNENIIHQDRDGMFYLGAGVKYRAQNNWGVRGDARLILAPSTDDGQTLDFEALLSVYREWGRPQKMAAPAAVKKDEDPDKDSIIGDADKCPNEPEDKDDFEDDNGCPDPDNDGDGVPDVGDKCPKEAEDKDNFEDDNGCPDPDNDADGVPDSADKCVDKPETKNGFEDDDGCPDEIPEAVKKFTGAIQGINFKVSSVDLAPGSDKILDKAVAVLAEFKNVKLEIQGHTDDQALKNNKTFADNTALSQGRAETVKAYMVKKGIEESRLVAKGYGETVPLEDPAGLKGEKLNAARIKNRRVEFKLITNDAAPAAPAPAPAPAPTPAP